MDEDLKTTETARKLVLYLIKNTQNGRTYVGQTGQPLDKRWKQHVQAALSGRSNTPLYQDINRLGRAAFEIKEIGSASSEEELDQLEIKAIKEFNSIFPDGYNL